MSLDSRECKCLQTCSQLPGSLQRSLKPPTISSLKSHIAGTGKIFSSYFFLVRTQSLQGLPNRQKCCRSCSFIALFLGLVQWFFFKVVFGFIFVVPERNYFFSAALETRCWISLDMFMGWMKDCMCERELNISVVKCHDFYLTHFQLGDANL